MSKKLFLRLSVLSMMGLLGGCGTFGMNAESEFSCPGMPDGITCADPITVYDHSNDLEDLEKLRQSKEELDNKEGKNTRDDDYDLLNEENGYLTSSTSRSNSSSNNSGSTAEHHQSIYVQDDAQPGDMVKVTSVRNGKKSSTVYQSYINQKQLIVQPESPMPILQPAEVARIWIAPWTDQSQDLHWPGYVFTEITSRKWTFGESTVGAIRPTLPVLIDNGHQSRLNRGRAKGRRYQTTRRTPTEYGNSAQASRAYSPSSGNRNTTNQRRATTFDGPPRIPPDAPPSNVSGSY